MICGRQLQLINAEQLNSLGFSSSTIRGRVAAERLHPTRFAGAYSLQPPPLNRVQTIKAAALSCGYRSLPSHWSAAEVLSLAEPPLLPVHVTRAAGNGRRREGIVVHRSEVDARDTGSGSGILCTSAARTIFDLAALAESQELEEMMIAANSLAILNWGRLEELVEAGHGRRGIRALRELVVDEPERARSRTEMAMRRICRAIDVEDPRMNAFLEVAGRRFEVDFHWPRLRLVVEVDGYRFHASRERLNDDRERDQLLTIAGWTVVRFTRDQVIETPEVVAERLRALTCTCR